MVSFWLGLLSATTATAAAQSFQLGFDYSERIPTGPLIGANMVTTAMDQQGAVYILANGSVNQEPAAGTCYLVKLSAAGSVVYQTTFAFYAAALAVDPAGNAYVAGGDKVAKVSAGGTTIYQTIVAGAGLLPGAITVDNTGRAYITGTVPAGYLKATPGAFQQFPPFAPGFDDGFVARLTSSGAIDYATYLGVSSFNGIAVDPSGTAFVIGKPYTNFPTTPGAYLASGQGAILARLSADGSELIYATYTEDGPACCIAVDSAGDAVVALQYQPGLSSVVTRFNPQGTSVLFSTVLPGTLFPAGVSVDGAGNTYVTSGYVAHNYPARNSLASCTAHSAALTVLDAKGNVLQATYIPGLYGTGSNTMAIGFGPNSTVSIVGILDPAYTPEQQLAGSSSGLLLLTRFSPNAQAQVTQLACVANAANYTSTTDMGIAGGELVALFGQGLGPTVGAQPQVSAQTGFPTQLAGVQVTFNGTPGPLLYVQDGQINAIAPWALQTGQTVEICAVYNDAQTNCIARTVVDADPGVFTVNGTYAIAVNQDGTANSASNPAKSGSIVTIFATGLGAISPPQPDGFIVGFPLPANVLPASVYYPGLPSEPFVPPFLSTPIAEVVDYAGPAPFQVAGISQINFVPVFPGSMLQAGQGSCTFLLYVQ